MSRRFVSPLVGFPAFFLTILLSSLVGGCGGSGNGGSGGGGGTTTPTPQLTAISPAVVNAGASTVSLSVTGSGFVNTSVVLLGGALENTAYVSATQLTATIPSAQLVNGGLFAVTVANGTVSSTSTTFEVDNPAPVMSSVSPATGVAGTASGVVTVTGSGFVPSTIVNVNGTARATTYINSTQVSAALPSTDFATATSLAVTAVNPTPGGGTSASSSLSIVNPSPGPIKLSPSVLNVGSTTAATITVTGTGFIQASVVKVAGTARTTTFVNSTTLTFTATVADQATLGTLSVTVTNPTPGGGTTAAVALGIVTPPVTPVITSVSPTSLLVGSGASVLLVYGTGFTTNTIVQWNGTNITSGYYSIGSGIYAIAATVPASYLTALGTASVTAYTSNASPSTSNAVTVSITNPPVPTITGLNPAGSAINTAATVTISGTGFSASTTASVNGASVPTTYVSSTQVTAAIPASALALPGNQSITVMTPAPGGGTSAAAPYTTYVSTPNNDLVYNSTDGLLYASVPATAAGANGNCVIGIDPYTGVIMKQIQVGTNPNKLALSTDGTQLFVGVDGAGAVAQIDLSQGKVVNQFSLGGGSAYYSTPYTAQYMAAVPGSPNSVAVASTGSVIAVYDSGVARSGTVTSIGSGPLSFGAAATTLYSGTSNYSYGIYALTLGATGFTKSTQVATLSSAITGLQYDNGSLYLSNGQVVNATTGVLQGSFYSSGSTLASGPIVSDSNLGRAFVAISNLNSTASIDAFDEKTYGLLGAIPVNALGTSGYSTSFRKIVRWGQNGIAVSAVPSSFTSNNQIFIFQSALVKDVSSSPADLMVAVTAPATATTGTATSYVVKVSNSGPNAAAGVTVAVGVDASLIVNSVTPSQGTCGNVTSLTCDLGSIASGSSVTITVNATATTAATIATSASVFSSSYDPVASNNLATGSTVVTGSGYNTVPATVSISPNVVAAGASPFSLTVNGSGFNSNSTVYLGGTAMTTSYVNSTQLVATVPTAAVTSYGWVPVTVSNPAPGGGTSAVLPLTIYAQVSVPANSIAFDPYKRALYATVPSTATGITNNSVVAIDPSTGTAGTPVFVGSQPTVMVESADGNILYISLSGSQSLAQYDLLQQKLTQNVTFSGQPTSYYGNSAATDLAVMPGNNATLAVNFGGTEGIMDINGTVGKFRTGFGSGNSPSFVDATHLSTSGGSSSDVARYTISSSGLTLQDDTYVSGIGAVTQSIGSFVYGQNGGIVNRSTTPPTQVQTLTLIDISGYGSAGQPVGIAADPSLRKDFLVLNNIAGLSAYAVVRYDLNNYLPEAFLSLPISSSTYSNVTTRRFGQDGLAFLSVDTSGSTPTTNMILVRGPFVAPQELTTSSAVALSSSSATTIAHGSGNILLTLTGTNFMPGVAVTWNGSYRTTTIVDTTHVTVAIPASDVSAAGTASVVATNPGASASNALTITIN